MSNEYKSQEKAATKLRRFRWLGYPVLILAIVLGVHWWRASSLASGHAPPLAGELVSAGRFDLDDSPGKPVLVYFWATWCPMCQFSENTIDAIAQDYKVVTIAIQSGSQQDIRAYLDRESLSFPVIADPSGELAALWGVSGVPTGFVVDGKGQVRFTTVGYTTGIGLKARLWAAGRMD